MEYDNEFHDMNSDNNSSEDDETFDNLSEIFDKSDFNINGILKINLAYLTTLRLWRCLCGLIFKYGDFVQYLSCELLQYGRIQSFVIKDNLIKVQMQQLLPYSRIPQNLYSLECELQTQEWLLDQLQPPLFDISVNEVLYYFYGSWKCRPIKFQNRHQSEYISTYPPPNSTMPVLKFFLDLYYDDFDTKEVFSLTIQLSNGYFYLQTILNNEHNALINQINILQTLRHLVDGGIDDRMPHYSTRSIFMPLIIAPLLRYLLSGWYINDYSLSSNDTSDQLQNEDNSNNITNSELFNCLEIKLGIRWNRNQIEAAGFISTNVKINGLFEDIMKAYSLYYLFEQALLETQVHFYENVSYTTLKPGGVTTAGRQFLTSTMMTGRLISIYYRPKKIRLLGLHKNAQFP
ncbi:23343_t:CDS:2, partial [Gigaspora rosea]